MVYTLQQQEEIWRFYFPGFQYKKYFLNPLREDKNAKCYFKESLGVIKFMDWAFHPTHINCITFVSLLYNIDGKNAIYKINSDLKYNTIRKIKMNFEGLKKSNLVEGVKSSIIFDKPLYEVEIKSYSDYELEYWYNYNISQELLKKYEIKPVKYVYKNNILDYSASKYNPIFGYYENGNLFKIYNPLGLKFQKWRTITALLEGFTKLEYNTNVLFITSSLKDTLCLTSLGFDAFNLPSENSYKILLPIINELFNKYEYIYVYLNNDDTGKNYSKLLTLEIDTRLSYINNPSMMIQTDPSDVIKDLGKEELLNIIQEKLKRDNVIIYDKKKKS